MVQIFPLVKKVDSGVITTEHVLVSYDSLELCHVAVRSEPSFNTVLLLKLLPLLLTFTS